MSPLGEDIGDHYIGMKNITIAIDGHSSCGKSTLAKELAATLDMLYIDSGAMYRAVTLFLLETGIAPDDHPAVEAVLPQLTITFREVKGDQQLFLNGRNVEEEIRSMAVSGSVSQVAAIPAVRRALVRQQQQLGSAGNIVMDGRDIGTVVFPDAELKLFVTASLAERAKRRHLQLREQGRPAPMEAILRNLLVRDYIDSTRSDSPLTQARDAVVIDNSNLSRTEQLAVTLALVQERTKSFFNTK